MKGEGKVQDYTMLGPKLRFADFQDPLKSDKMGSVFDNFTDKGRQGLPIYSVTLNEGLVPRNSLDRHMHADAAVDKNISVKKTFLAYNMMRMWQGAIGIAPVDCMVSPAYVVLKPKSETCSEFFLQWFKNPRMLYLLWAYSYGLTNDRLRLYYKDFAQIPIKYPTLPEQKKIAAFFGAVDEKLAALRQRRDLLTRYKRGLMQKLFSQTLRFTRDDGTAFPDWEEKRLGDLLREHKEKRSSTEEVFSVSVKKGLVNQIEHLGRSFAASDTKNYNKVKPHDVVYTKSPTGAFPLGIIKQSHVGKDVIVSPLYGVFTPTNQYIGYLIDAYFQSSSKTNRFLAPIVQKGAKNTINVSNSDFLTGKLFLPVSEEEQQKIASALQAMDAKIDAVTAETEQIETFKKALLQQMFV